MANQKIKFVDRDDLLKKLEAEKIIMKKSDVNKEGSVTALQNALKRYKRGDKQAMTEVIKLRKKMLKMSSETFIEVEEDQLFSAAVAELEIVENIDIEE
jgi:hypothetical protein